MRPLFQRTRLACLAAFAVPSFVVGVASAQASGGVGGSVSGSATVEVGGQPAPAPPPPVVYQPAPAPAPAPTYANAPPPGYAYPPPPPPPPPAGPPPGAYTHDGFYLRFALGGGYASANANLSNANTSTSVPDYTVKGGGVAFDLALGGTVGSGVVIGGEILAQQMYHPTVSSANGGSFTDNNNNANFSLIGPFIDWYPNPENGFHVGGMLGLAALTVSPDCSSSGTVDCNSSTGNYGFGGALGVGYDFWVAPEWSLGILGKFYGGTVSSSGNQTLYGVSADERWSVGAFSLFFSALYH